MTTKLLRFGLICLLSQFITQAAFSQQPQWFKTAVDRSAAQLNLSTKKYLPQHNPRSIEPDGSVRLTSPKDWTCGFYPGNLWYIYELTGNDYFKQQAQRYTEALDTVKYFTHTHDVGFMLYCSFGNGYRLTQNPNYKKVLIKGAKSLTSRYNPTVGCIRSWDFGPWQYPVIIDNMMNLEFIMWASKAAHNEKYREMAISHAKTTMKNHFRKDYSSFHVVSYDTISGKAIQHQTFQGYADNSAWARGQGWGVYGYTMMYRETGKKKFLKQAKKIAEFIMNNPTLPQDKVPYWDFDAPNIPNAPRDASAAAVMACGLFELSTYTKDGEKYFSFAESILKSLSSSKYLAKEGNNAYFILKHSVGSLPNNSEVNTPINYADYYYLEALLRYAHLKKFNLPLN